MKKRERDNDKEDGTGELDNAKNRELPDLNMETVTHVANGDSRDGGRKRDAARRAPENHTRATHAGHTREITTLQGSRRWGR